MHRGIGVEDAAPVSVERPVAFIARAARSIKSSLRPGIEAREHIEKGAVQFGRGCRGKWRAAQCPRPAADAPAHRPAPAWRPRSHRQPSSAKAELLADHFHVRDQMRQRIVFAAALGAASAGAALVKQHGMKTLRIEQPPMIGLAAAAGAAVQIDRGDAIGTADGFDIDLVAVADRQQLRGQWREWVGAVARRFARIGVRRHVRRPSPACRRQNCDR